MNCGLNRLRNILFLVAAVALSDIHWSVMQIATWIEMAADSASRNEPVLTSVYESVTGEKKCPKCCQLEKEKKRDDESVAQWESKSLGLNSNHPEKLFPPVPPYRAAVFEHETAISRREAPIPLPPWALVV
ncbi:MAG: hypothetical protein P1V20_19015 [Verrucomicrobiales bacterium]|nr:hypothetical protein [Verrucomicrobiales bacterium]